MKNGCFRSAVALVAIVLCLEIVQGSWHLKEGTWRPIHGHYCGDTLMSVYKSLCRYHNGKRKRSSALLDEKKASSFLHAQTIRSKRSKTNIVEECCVEGCRYEEVHEYC